MAFRQCARMVAAAILVAAATGARAARIDLVRLTAGHPDSHTCGTVVPLGPPLAIGAYAVLDAGGEGISGAEFFIRTQDPAAYPMDLQALGWTISVQPNPAATAAIGNPMVPDPHGGFPIRRANIVFAVDPSNLEGCQSPDAPVLLYRLGIFNRFHPDAPIPPNTELLVVAADPPGNPQFRCPLVNLCDAPTFTKVCVGGGVFVINPSGASCIDAVTPQTWSGVKGLFR
jgi:hypothetical protein